MIRKAYAKINLALNVLAKRDDGYHDLDMIMMPIGLYDKLTFTKTDDQKIILSTNTTQLSSGKRNLVYQAADLFIKTYDIRYGVKIHIEKHIPSKAGLAGGSSDAACTLKALNDLFNVKATKKELACLAIQLGSDVPFFIYERLARVGDKGDVIECLDMQLHSEVLLVKPKQGIKTKDAFCNIDFATLNHCNIDKAIEMIEKDDYQSFCQMISNDLEISAIAILDEIQVIKDQLASFGFETIMMSGSGSTVFALTRNAKVIQDAKKHFLNKKCFVYHTQLIN